MNKKVKIGNTITIVKTWHGDKYKGKNFYVYHANRDGTFNIRNLDGSKIHDMDWVNSKLGGMCYIEYKVSNVKEKLDKLLNEI